MKIAPSLMFRNVTSLRGFKEVERCEKGMEGDERNSKVQAK
jgi:hypothetical protein